MSVIGGFLLIKTWGSCILRGRPVGLLGVCGRDGVMKVYSVFSAEYRGSNAVCIVCTVRYRWFPASAGTRFEGRRR
jgi:hypothetical protein